MRKCILVDQKRRKEKLYQFYYQLYGEIIKRKRLELRYTQEYLAMGICSNTYISKIENKQTMIGQEQLYLIMERLNTSTNEYAAPEDLILYLEQSLEYFYYQNVDDYRTLYEKLSQFEFTAIIEVIKLGYYVLLEENKKARAVYEELLVYLSSMDDYCFSAYILFATFLNIYSQKYDDAKFFFDFFHKINNHYAIALSYYTMFIVNGFLHLFAQAFEAYDLAMKFFIKDINAVRMNESMIYYQLFMTYDGKEVNFSQFDLLVSHSSRYAVQSLIVTKAYLSSTPEDYVKFLKEDDEAYIIGLYILAKSYLNRNEKESYKKIKTKMESYHYKLKSPIDYVNLLELQEKNNVAFYKDYLINYCLKTALNNQNIFFIKQIKDLIVKILTDSKRYKDALTYEFNVNEKIKLIQFGKKIER